MAPLRVLVVDDTAQVRRDLRSMLALCGGIEVVGEAGNGQEAIQQERILAPDVVLMDLAMPVMDGFEAAQRIKGRRPGCRIVALSVHAGDEDRRLAFLAGVDAFVVKGAPVATLMESLHGGPSTEPTPSGDAT